MVPGPGGRNANIPAFYGVMASDDFRMLRCATAGVEAVVANSRHSFSRHTHQQFGVGAIDFGAHRSHSGRGQVEAAAGDAITVNPGEVHDGAPIGEGGRSWRMLYFEPRLILDVAEEVFEDRSGDFELTRPVIGDSRVANLFRQLFAMETAAGMEGIRREELLLTLIASIGQYRFERAPAAPTSLAQARSRLDDDPGSAITLADLARISGMSRFHFLRAFSGATGLTPHRYLIQRRIDEARRLIADGTALADAAAAAGFADQSHMTRTFVRKYGLSPGAYARAVAPRRNIVQD